MVEIIIKNFKVMPYVRMTQRGKYIKPRAINYIQNQKQLAWLIKINAKGNMPPFPVFVKIMIGMKNIKNNADWDNYVKAVMDALVKATLLPGDSLQYVRGGKCKLIKAKLDYISIVIKPL